VWVTLDVQTLDGAVRIVDATPQRGTSGKLASCVRAEMVGRQVAVAEARAGRAFKLPYPMAD
jgi:hypothetical protein